MTDPGGSATAGVKVRWLASRIAVVPAMRLLQSPLMQTTRLSGRSESGLNGLLKVTVMTLFRATPVDPGEGSVRVTPPWLVSESPDADVVKVLLNAETALPLLSVTAPASTLIV